jgi:hypothetical protein
LVEDENGGMLANSHSIWNRRRKYLCHLLNIQAVNDIRQFKIHVVGPLVPEPSSFEVKIVIEKLKMYNC